VEKTVGGLNRIGIGRNDRVVLVLPTGPEMAAACLAVMAGATCSPLNPAYGAEELHFFLGDLKAKLVITSSGCDSPVRRVAHARGVPCAELSPVAGAPAGLFTFGPVGSPVSAPAVFAGPDDVALTLHTSGTTSRPKLAPLTHRDLCAAAHLIRTTLELTPGDRCLNVMPLFHLHALSILLASMAAGASVYCPPPFDETQFFRWYDELRPTWYSAAPTLHQAILGQARAHHDLIARSPLRFIRSISAALPPSVLTEMEQVFHAPVIEAYGLTETPSQVASNPIPPGKRKVGSVGLAMGPETAIMDRDGRLFPAGQVGEVVIRGPHVLRAYENNPEANAASFRDAWFRYFDHEGYLFIQGRLKEVISRGGEKISPLEIEGALYEHPAIAQAAAFAVPHARLGEDLMAAVVLREGAAATEWEIRTFVANRLASFKVPRRVLIREELPRSSTGKLQRSRLAEQLGLAGNGPPPAGTTGRGVPRSALEESLAHLFAEILRLPAVGIDDDFYGSGGDSLAATLLHHRIAKEFGRPLPRAALFGEVSVARLAEILGNPPAENTEPTLVQIQPLGWAPPFFCVHGLGGEVHSFAALARHLVPDQPLFGFRTPAEDGYLRPFSQIETMATHYVAEMRRVQPEGPYHLGGYSMGAVVAFEMCQQLRAQGQRAALLVLIDQSTPVLPSRHPGRTGPGYVVEFLANLPLWVRDELLYPTTKGFLVRLMRQLRVARRKISGSWSSDTPTSSGTQIASRFDVSRISEQFRGVLEAHDVAVQKYVPRPYPGPATLIRARTRPLFRPHGDDLGWGRYVQGGLEVIRVPGNHDSILKEPHVGVLARMIKKLIRQPSFSFPGAHRPPRVTANKASGGGFLRGR
jgi:acyl-CoA synthetase (AMP-forming)/AMP-acid ligase II/thioesterase domain-containing protein